MPPVRTRKLLLMWLHMQIYGWNGKTVSLIRKEISGFCCELGVASELELKCAGGGFQAAGPLHQGVWQVAASIHSCIT